MHTRTIPKIHRKSALMLLVVISIFLIYNSNLGVPEKNKNQTIQQEPGEIKEPEQREIKTQPPSEEQPQQAAQPSEPENESPIDQEILAISNVKITNGYLEIRDQDEEDTVTVQWETNLPADSKVELYIDNIRVDEKYLPEKITKHTIILDRFQPGTTHSLKIYSTDDSGATALAEGHSFTVPWMRIYFFLPREVTEDSYYQIIKNLTITTNIQPTGIIDFKNYGNNYKLLYWNSEQSDGIIFYPDEGGKGIVQEGELKVSFKVLVERTTNNLVIENSQSPYPLPENQIPEEIRPYLQPSSTCQSDSPEIMSLSQKISQGSTRQHEVVYNTVLWINKNIKEGVCGATEYEDALSTLEHKEGVCRHFARLTCALLRAQGIPSRLAKNYFINHEWVQAYYPDIGWVSYDPIAENTDELISDIIEFEVTPPPMIRDELCPYIPFFSCSYVRKTSPIIDHHKEIKNLGNNKYEYTLSYSWKVIQETNYQKTLSASPGIFLYFAHLPP